MCQNIGDEVKRTSSGTHFALRVYGVWCCKTPVVFGVGIGEVLIKNEHPHPAHEEGGRRGNRASPSIHLLSVVDFI